MGIPLKGPSESVASGVLMRTVVVYRSIVHGHISIRFTLGQRPKQNLNKIDSAITFVDGSTTTEGKARRLFSQG